MKSRHGNKGYVLQGRSCELKDGGFSAEFSAEEHDAPASSKLGSIYPNAFPTGQSVIKAAIHAGRQQDRPGFERGPAVVSGCS
jgi:hypothetical protein